jgi:hypothetical protein
MRRTAWVGKREHSVVFNVAVFTRRNSLPFPTHGLRLRLFEVYNNNRSRADLRKVSWEDVDTSTVSRHFLAELAHNSGSLVFLVLLADDSRTRFYRVMQSASHGGLVLVPLTPAELQSSYSRPFGSSSCWGLLDQNTKLSQLLIPRLQSPERHPITSTVCSFRHHTLNVIGIRLHPKTESHLYATASNVSVQ